MSNIISPLEAIRREKARRTLLEFTTYTKPNYVTNWHHHYLCQKLDLFAQGHIKRLMVFMPPRHGKSELVSRRLPAFIFGNRPNAQIIAASYGADLAHRMNRDVQRIMDSQRYRNVFPTVGLSSKNVKTTSHESKLRNSEIFEIMGAPILQLDPNTGSPIYGEPYTGVYQCAGVGGALTGMGGDYIIVDDPIKNQEEADSKVYRDKVWDFFTSVLYTRLETDLTGESANSDDGSILITMTRWHEDDLAGRLKDLMEKDPEADKYEIISFPAIIETDEEEENEIDPRIEGEALWPAKYNEKKLRVVKKTMGSRKWAALFEQRPAPDKGDIVDRSWWRYWKELPAQYDHIMISVDCAFKGKKTSDFVVIQVWMKVGARKYLIDQTRDRMSFTATVSAIEAMKSKWPQAVEVLVESKANGDAVMDTLKEKIPGLVAFNPKDSKESRAKATAVSPQIEAGNVWIPHPSICAWTKDYVDEWAVFPNGANDDQVDATTQALLRMHNDGFGWLQVLEADPSDMASMTEDLKEQLWGHLMNQS